MCGYASHFGFARGAFTPVERAYLGLCQKNFSLEHQDEQLDFFEKYLPEDETSVAHLDYMMHNMMFHPTENRVIAVLDWETSTIGHPLADLGYFSQLFYRDWPDGFANAPADKVAGIPTPEEIVDLYSRAAGRKQGVKQFEYHVAFAMYRTTVIHQGIAGRVLAGTASNAAAQLIKSSVPQTNARCLDFIRGLRAKWEKEGAAKAKI
ncbi:hypothetical protein M427DRAFT_29297 [Gonapodya prolifera JEL478]|uniref:Aminoglycoside phosphotransferase domain-containing protein n=1 Tax=Gonapodya prolifera (strain JEL478) TaxID=1344416 RepID=A0A139AQ20_GONPJ|nr:hypothetical protein M427DRAFT_29297 [Gonapodya prolifera JEL478]|eukprot:KXS18822.1 hypothetical protein M427DRAFT_29297 [Gonapodya prolifera JEL478]